MKTPSQPRAIYYIVAIQIWEYFSFYGMRALLILYLTHQLGFDDNHAISLFSAYASLVYVTPILGGWLPDMPSGLRQARRYTVSAGMYKSLRQAQPQAHLLRPGSEPHRLS